MFLYTISMGLLDRAKASTKFMIRNYAESIEMKQ